MSTRTQKVVTTIVVAGASLVAGSPALMEFLEKWESGKTRVLTVYSDKLANGLPTVCNGLTRHATSTPIIVGQKWTTERCEIEEQAAVVRVQEAISKCIAVPVSQNTLDAFSSFAYNVGPAAACGSVAVGLLNAGNLQEACRSIAFTPVGSPNWSIASGKFYRGLHNRRVDEMGLCSTPEGST
jgi:GH24 family phage-related lysozyme (muramidase)